MMSLSKIQLTTHAEGVRLGINEVIGCNDTVADWPRIRPRVDVVEHALAIRVDVPIQAHRHVLHHATLNLMIRHIQVGPTTGDLPGSPAATAFRNAMKWNNAIDGASFAIVRSMFAGEKPSHLRVRSVEKSVACSRGIDKASHGFALPR